METNGQIHRTDRRGKTWTLSGDYCYSIKNTGFNSQRLGNCEVCSEPCSSVYLQSEQRRFDAGDYLERWTHHECKDTLFGHKECLESARRIAYQPKSFTVDIIEQREEPPKINLPKTKRLNLLDG